MWVKLVEGNTSHRQQNTVLHARSEYAVAFTAWCVLSVYPSNRHFIWHLLIFSLRDLISQLLTWLYPHLSFFKKKIYFLINGKGV